MTSLERRAVARRLLGVSLLALVGGVLLARLATHPNVPEHQDAEHFVRALERYSLAERRPHFPGYPVYVWIGRALAPVEADPLRRLHLVAAAASALCLVPLGLLGWRSRERSGGTPAEALLAGLAVPLLWTLAPLAWVAGNEAVSDPPGLLLGLVALVASSAALDGLATAPEAAAKPGRVAAVCAGLMLGVRPTYLPLAAPFAVVVAALAARAGSGRRVAVQAVGLFLGVVALWWGWQLAMDGARYFEAARSHVQGHAEGWGGSLFTDPAPWSRPQRFVATVGAGWVGRDGLGALRPAALLGLAALAVAGAARLTRSGAWGPLTLVFAWLAAYSLTVLLGFDVELGRYALPVLPILALLAGLGLPRGRLALVLLLALLVPLGAQTARLAAAHEQAPRLGHRLAAWLARHVDGSRHVLLATQAAPNLEFYVRAAGVPIVVRFQAADRLSLDAEKLAASGRETLASEPDPGRPEAWQPLVRFCRDSLAEETGITELWLYRYAPGGRQPPEPLSCQ